MTPAEIGAAVESLVGEKTREVQRLHGFAGNSAFEIITNTDRYVLKAATAGGVMAEAAVCAKVRTLGVPAPEVLVVDTSGSHLGSPFLLMRHTGGEPVGDDSDVLRAAGRYLRAVHDVTLDGFGWLGDSATGLDGPESCWSAAIHECFAALPAVVSARLMPGELAERVEDAVTRHADCLNR